MARNFRDLATDLRAIPQSISKQTSDEAAAVALAIVSDLAQVTPVDTSKALSNWRVSLNQRTVLAIPPHTLGKAGSSQEESIKATIDAAKLVLAAKKPGDVIWISNVLPYIQRLNDGYSAQEPAGFVERAVLIGRKLSEKTKIVL
jgi:hypothetical protein